MWGRGSGVVRVDIHHVDVRIDVPTHRAHTGVPLLLVHLHVFFLFLFVPLFVPLFLFLLLRGRGLGSRVGNFLTELQRRCGLVSLVV